MRVVSTCIAFIHFHFYSIVTCLVEGILKVFVFYAILLIADPIVRRYLALILYKLLTVLYIL